MTIELRDVTGKKLTKFDLDYTSKRSGEEQIGRFIADVNKGKLYAIPEDIDHPEFVELLTGKTKAEMKKDPMKYNHFVGIGIGVQNNIVTRIIVGISGFEFVMTYAMKKMSGSAAPVRYHTNEQLLKARDIAYAFVIDSEMPLASKHQVMMAEVV
ncbi:MAG: hypothetical protein QW165_00845 [Candidatus Woesearchaeota archaeon]